MPALRRQVYSCSSFDSHHGQSDKAQSREKPHLKEQCMTPEGEAHLGFTHATYIHAYAHKYMYLHANMPIYTHAQKEKTTTKLLKLLINLILLTCSRNEMKYSLV